MKKGRTPGPDGIPAEFYQQFWPIIKDVLYDSFAESFVKNTMNHSAMDGVLNLIPKKNRDTRMLKNLRPITLLNVDYKIIEKTVANRIRSVLDKLIDSDQTGFMSKRRISTNIRRILDIMNYAEKQDLPIIIYNLDFLKAFDRVEISSMIKSLEYFNFPPFITRWISILYSHFSVWVQNNGYFSDPIIVERSVHQGGCASAFLFNLLVETLAIHLRNKMSENAIEVAGHQHILGQYADNTSAYSYFTQQSINTIFDELTFFQKQTGLTINYDKTSIYRVVSLKNSKAELYTAKPAAWTNDSISVLGIEIAHENLCELNYQPVIKQCKTIISCWKSRRLSLFGKICVLNSLITSLFVHKMMVIPNLPQKMMLELENMCVDFIWNGKKPKISLRELQKPRSAGGANLVNLSTKQCALKCSWVLLLSDNRKYATLAFSLFAPELQYDVFRCNFCRNDVKYVCGAETPLFWQDVLDVWATFNYNSHKKCVEQLLWWNSRIHIENKPFFWADVYAKGLRSVQQLYSGAMLISVRSAYQRFGLDFMRFHALVCAIPSEWREECRAELSPNAELQTCFDVVIQKQKVSRYVYCSLQEQVWTQRNVVTRWSIDLDQEISGDNLMKACRDIYTNTNIPRLRSFQLRFIHRAIVLNCHLFRWNMRDNNLCSMCHQEKETILHLFFQCEKVYQMWEGIARYVSIKTGEKLALTVDEIIWCDCNNKLLSSIVLCIKQYIYSQRCLGEQVSEAGAIGKIRQLEITEKFIAKKNGKLKLHCLKWNVE